MPEQLQQLWGALPERLRTLSPTRLFVLLGLLALGIAGGVVALLWLQEPQEHRLLYSQLTAEDAGMITARLKEMHIPYTLQGDGTTILVPANMVYDARLRLATEGLPHKGGVGFELFDKQTFGMTAEMQKLNYRRALQGELERSITQLAAVQQVRVHIVIPEKALFREQQDRTTASVVLTLRPGRQLSAQQIDGITRLVASSVEGLNASEVTVIDHNGQVLSRNDQQGPFGQGEARLNLQHQMEGQLEQRVQTLLEQTIGKGRVHVRVSAALDFQHIERTEKRYDADNPVIRSEQRTREEGNGPGYWAIGIPGARSNAPDANAQNNANAANAQQPNERTSSARQSEVINYEVTEVQNKIVIPSGSVQKLSVAVLVDGTYQAGANAGDALKYVPRSDEEIAKYRDIVKGAIGFNEGRGDRVEVASAPFQAQQDADSTLLASESKRLLWFQIGRYGIYLLIALLCFLGIVRPLMRWIMTPEERPEDQIMIPRTVEELEAEMSEEREAALVGAGAGGEGIRAHLPTTTMVPQDADLRSRLAVFAQSDPERAVEIIRFWLKRG